MEDKVLAEAEKICEMMFPESEVGQCVLHHHLACFAEYVEVQSLLKFREDVHGQSAYKPDEVKHG